MVNKTFLIRYFGVSEEAAEKRLETLGKYQSEWRTEEEKMFDEAILFKYEGFMDKILPKKIIAREGDYLFSGIKKY